MLTVLARGDGAELLVRLLVRLLTRLAAETTFGVLPGWAGVMVLGGVLLTPVVLLGSVFVRAWYADRCAYRDWSVALKRVEMQRVEEALRRSR
jgi:hypothetical protein